MGVADDAERALQMVRESPVVVYDCETSGVDWRVNFPVGYVVGDSPENVVYVPVRHGGGGNLPDPECSVPDTADGDYTQHQFERKLAEAFEERRSRGFLTVGHNVKFDCHASANGGVYLGRNIECTQNNEALLDEHAISYDLASSAKRRGVTAKQGDRLYQHIADQFGVPADRSAMSEFWRLPGQDPLAVEYAVGDGVTTLELWRVQQDLITKEGIKDIHSLESRLIWTLFRMERRGIRVDIDYLYQLRDYIQQGVDEAAARLPEGFNTRSPVHMRNYMERLGYTDWPLTDKGNPSFSESWLRQFPEGRDVITVRRWTNLRNSFINPLLNQHVFKGRVHPSINQLRDGDYGTVSGRLSCSNPNLQQIPKHDKELATLFRRAFVPDEGYLLVEADWSQAEPRLFAHYSQDKALVEGYNADPPRDMHQIVADMFQVDRGWTAKRMNMGILTGMFPTAFAGHMNWSIEDAKHYWNKWWELFPGVSGFQQKATKVMRSRGYVKTILGRKCRLNKPKLDYQAVSRIIQGSQADLMKKKILEIDEMLERDGDNGHLLMSVHDALLWQVPDTPEHREYNNGIVDWMSEVQGPDIGLRVPFVAEAGTGYSWRETTFGEP